MALDFRRGTGQVDKASAKPNLRIVGLHIGELKAIHSLDLPKDGLGWGLEIPEIVMLGGINGSGKSTLLEFLLHAVFSLDRMHNIENFPADEAWVDFSFCWPSIFNMTARFIIGDERFVKDNSGDNWFGFVRTRSGSKSEQDVIFQGEGKVFNAMLNNFLRDNKRHIETAPSIVYFASERRTLVVPETKYKSAGKMTDSVEFIQQWQPPTDWKSSLEARIYSLRWDDLNAKEEGRLHEANKFESYSRAFDQFFEGRKQIKWRQGELIVETKSGAIHGLSELSSGEKQVILFMGELLHRWRPGSLILIDEPELHLHESFQTKLWEALLRWQKERGGQVIVATQSDHLFGLSGPGTRVILGGGRS